MQDEKSSASSTRRGNIVLETCEAIRKVRKLILGLTKPSWSLVISDFTIGKGMLV